MEAKSPLIQLREVGQSPWCDQLSRELLESGQLARMVSLDGITCLTPTPAIFHKALSVGRSYDHQIRDAAERRLDGKAIYEDLAVRDIQAVADLLLPVYKSTDRLDGYVSLEVSPGLAHDTQGSVVEARRLWKAVDRPNLMVKIPGTTAGLPAITTLLADGINVNVTLVFGLRGYRQGLAAHDAGLCLGRAPGLGLSGMCSVR